MMNHAITIGGLLLGIGAFGGLLALCFGALMVFAAGMSDATGQGDGGGCIVALVGAVVFIGCVIGLAL